jgi:phosphoglycolate phosphatase
MRYNAVIFDLDGTLLDTIADLANSTNSVLERHGFKIHSVEKYKTFVGNGLQNLLQKALPEDRRDDRTIEKCLIDLHEEYARRWAENTRPYDGMPELLSSLQSKNISMAILSNKAHKFTKAIVETLLSDWRFTAVFGERAGIPRKPDPSAALEIAGMLEASPSDILYLGDSGTDMETANAAGMCPVGALWGFRSREELIQSGARHLIQKPSELLELL